jgi:hypothetical protein
MLTGSETIRYTNNSPDTLKVFYIHLYPNAFKEKDSQLVRDYRPGTWRFLMGLKEENRGWIDIDSFKVGGVETQFEVDGTILSGSFSRPLRPGATIDFEIVFTEKIRKRIGRAGYVGRRYDLAQWYPKMVVYDERGWHADQFRIGEFYGEFGTYDVSITLPGDYVVAATGQPVSGDPGWTGGEEETAENKTVRFRAENVHDFALCADPDFIVEDTTLAGGTKVMSFYRRWNRSWADTALARTVRTVEWLEDLVGPYQWPVLSIVDTPTRGGMEYPMLVMNSSADMGLIVHEVAHMWFYGMLANNERDEAWIDEGLAQYHMFRYLDEHYGPYGRPHNKSTFSWLDPPNTMWEGVAGSVIDMHRSDFAEPLDTPYHEFQSSGRVMVYNKSALFFRALRRHVGDEDFQTILRTWFELWKFKHVDEEILIAVCEDVTGERMGDFFKQWISSVKDCDYKLDRFKVEKAGELYNAEVRMKRRGEMIMPVDLEFELEDGGTMTERLDGISRSVEKNFTFVSKPKSVSINPSNEILDAYQLDNNSPRKRKLSLDWPPRRNWPSDAFQYLILPIGYYNDIDGGKTGVRLRGGYDDLYRKFVLQGMYGFESEEIDFYGRFEHPVGWLKRSTKLTLEGFYREGRQGASIVIDKIQRKHLSDPMPRYWQFRFVYHELRNPAYVLPGTYDEGLNLKLGVRVGVAPKMDIFSSSFFFDFDKSFWGSDHSYERFTFESTLRATRKFPFPIKPRFRAWFGNSANYPPLQERVNLAGAGVLETEKYFWLRSVGAFPKDQYNHFHIPGNANLRGYFDANFAFKRIFSVNCELGLRLPFGRKRHGGGGGSGMLYAFYDGGAVLDNKPFDTLPLHLQETLGPNFFDAWLQDFGVGLQIWKLKAEFPLYISQPILTGEEKDWDFRWTVGIHSLF